MAASVAGRPGRCDGVREGEQVFMGGRVLDPPLHLKAEQVDSRSGAASRIAAVAHSEMSVYARKLQVEMVIEGERRAAPLDWLDSFCMRNFTGSAEFDDTLPTGEGLMEAGLKVNPSRLAEAMSEWFTKRGKGGGKPVKIEIRERQ